MGIFTELLRVTSPIGRAASYQRNSGEEANEYLNKIPGVAKEYNQPYVDELRDPEGYLNKILGSYKQSEGYKFKENRLREGARREAAAGGFRGTETDTENQSALVNALLEEDMQNYIKNYGEAHRRGGEASSQLGDILGSNLNQQGSLAFHGAEGANARRNALLRQLLQTGGQIAGAGMGMPGGGGGIEEEQMYGGEDMPQNSYYGNNSAYRDDNRRNPEGANRFRLGQTTRPNDPNNIANWNRQRSPSNIPGYGLDTSLATWSRSNRSGY